MVITKEYKYNIQLEYLSTQDYFMTIFNIVLPASEKFLTPYKACMLPVKMTS